MKMSPVSLIAIAVLALSVGSSGRAQDQARTLTISSDPLSREVEQKREEKVNLDRAMHDAEMAEHAAKLAAESAKFRTAHFFGNKQDHELDAKIRQAAAQVRDARDQAAKAATTKELVSLLDQYFEHDMAARGEELQDIQARLQKLQAQLDRRRAKKQEIVELQLKVALNEADGLGFYGESKDAGVFTFRVQQAPVVVTPSGDTLMPSVMPAQPAVPPAPPLVPE
jgi:hypothetical protein